MKPRREVTPEIIEDERLAAEPEQLQFLRLKQIMMSNAATHKGSISSARVRWKPVVQEAIYVEGIDEERGGRRIAGWFTSSPRGQAMYIPEEEFSRFFEIVKDEVTIGG